MAKKIYLDSRESPVYITLLGISCHLKDYRLSYLLNYHIPAEFSKLDDLKIMPAAKKESSEFSFYYFKDEDRFNSYSLISNRNQESALIAEMKQTDFILIVEGEFRKPQKDALLKNIKAIPNVLTCYELKLAEIKNHEHLLSEIELHVMKQHRSAKTQYKPSQLK